MMNGNAGLASRIFTMDLFEVKEIIDKIADGFEQACADCMRDNSSRFETAVKEQLFSGMDGEGNILAPSYQDDPYFDRVRWFHYDDSTGKTYHGAVGYQEWKKDITPPMRGSVIGYPARPETAPNLYIDGTFYSTIESRPTPVGVEIFSGSETGREIEGKYGSAIFAVADLGKGWFNENFMLPAIKEFFRRCGYGV